MHYNLRHGFLTGDMQPAVAPSILIGIYWIILSQLAKLLFYNC
jgi:hypothetical protein